MQSKLVVYRSSPPEVFLWNLLYIFRTPFPMTFLEDYYCVYKCSHYANQFLPTEKFRICEVLFWHLFNCHTAFISEVFCVISEIWLSLAVDIIQIIQKDPPQLFCKKSVIKNFTEKHSNTGVFLWNLPNFEEHLYWTSVNDCLWKFLIPQVTLTINSFLAKGPISPPLKTPENHRFSSAFKG